MCIAASYNLYGWNASTSSRTNSLLAMSLNTYKLFWLLEFSGIESSYSILWRVQGYENNTYFTIHTLVDIPQAGNCDVDSKAIYLKSQNTLIAVQDGFSAVAPGSNVPSADLQFVIEKVFAGNNFVYYIKSRNDGLYLNYQLALTETPTPFYLN
jgi:hypothetical protein